MTDQKIKSSYPEALHQLAKFFLEIPFNHMLGLRLDELEQSHIKLSFDMKEELIGNYFYGILHGGVISSVLDMAGGMAAMVSVIYKLHKDHPPGELKKLLGKSSTIDLHVSYVQPGKGDRFIANAAVIHTGNKISFTNMELFTQEMKLIARASGTYLIG